MAEPRATSDVSFRLRSLFILLLFFLRVPNFSKSAKAVPRLFFFRVCPPAGRLFLEAGHFY